MKAVLRTCFLRTVALLAGLLSPLRRSAYLRRPGPRKLQIGAGTSLASGWLVTDLEPLNLRVVRLDATRRFPFPDAVFDYVHSEHMIEHVPYSDALKMLAECCRVLKPGGRIRIATPDIAVLLDLYYRRDDPAGRRYVEWITDHCLPNAPGYNPLFVINNAMRAWGHQFLYDGPLLIATLERCGFVDVCQHRPGSSDDPVLHGIEHHGQFIGDEAINQYETMVFEARRPS